IVLSWPALRRLGNRPYATVRSRRSTGSGGKRKIEGRAVPARSLMREPLTSGGSTRISQPSQPGKPFADGAQSVHGPSDGVDSGCRYECRARYRAAIHSIVSSARASRLGGTSRPSILAVLRLITV